MLSNYFIIITGYLTLDIYRLNIPSLFSYSFIVFHSEFVYSMLEMQ